MSDTEKTKVQLLAEIEALQKRLREMEDKQDPESASADEHADEPSGMSRRDMLGVWVTPIVLSLPLAPDRAQAQTESPTPAPQPTASPPTQQPTTLPTVSPTSVPTFAPSAEPTTIAPSASPTTSAPTVSPTTSAPTASPTMPTSPTINEVFTDQFEDPPAPTAAPTVTRSTRSPAVSN